MSENRRTLADAPAPNAEGVRQILATLNREDYIRRLVDEAPPLTDEQRRRLAVILRPAVRPPDVGDDVLDVIEEGRQ